MQPHANTPTHEHLLHTQTQQQEVMMQRMLQPWRSWCPKCQTSSASCAQTPLSMCPTRAMARRGPSTASTWCVAVLAVCETVRLTVCQTIRLNVRQAEATLVHTAQAVVHGQLHCAAAGCGLVACCMVGTRIRSSGTTWPSAILPKTACTESLQLPSTYCGLLYHGSTTRKSALSGHTAKRLICVMALECR